MTFTDWKNLPITVEILLELDKRIKELTAELVTSAGQDSRNDAWRSGVIAGYKDLLDIDLQESST